MAQMSFDDDESFDSDSSIGSDFDDDDMDVDGLQDQECLTMASPTSHPRSMLREDTLLIFDWDDTILPSTWIQKQGLRLTSDSVVTDDQGQVLKKLSRSASRMLRAAKRYGRVVLVTNAERGWVELSCKKFLPWLLPVLEGVKILSARAEYERRGVTSPFEWKYLAFESEINNWCSFISAQAVTNIVSIGDAGHERQALLRTTKGIPNCRAKSVKLVERPVVPQLQKQHELLNTVIGQIARHDGNLDLRFKFD
eukprot:TRINITY_DN7806_c0_g2_i1.p1 TRINITY_DN7806_c0_g2~~TRINITY_DN7806_c0_g2_i1.p1  ORF type:complete len:253 (-),score=41.07 TRINITY_DN7806_c0_g2_i1:262-1020(-)